jgi:hypothetical protein
MASSVVDAFSKVTNFIYSLFDKIVKTGVAKKDEDEMDIAESGKDESGKDESGKDESGKAAPSKDESGKAAPSKDESVNGVELKQIRGNISVFIAEIKIDDLTIYFQIPKTLSFDNGNLFALDINKSTINEINNRNLGYKLSLTQYFRFNSNGNNNSIVIDLIINNAEHIYICVEYSSSGEIQIKGLGNLSYYTYTNYNSISDYFKSIVPDPNARRSRTENKYNYEAQLADYIFNAQTTEKVMIAKDALSPAKFSLYSPVDKSNNTYSNLSIDSKMYDLHRHAVEGLGAIAENRYTANSGEVNTLATNTSGKSIKDQTKPLLFDRKIKLAQATRDLVDVAHDFRAITNMGNFVNIISAGDEKFKGDLNVNLNGLLSDAGNINVANSHQILKDNIRGLEEDLRNQKLNFPHIPTEKYVSRDYVFAMFIIDMMNTTMEKKQIRSNYSESGKQVTIETFRKYYESLDDAEKDTFDLYVVKIMGQGAVSKAIAGYLPEYPSISKKIDLDGCSTGPTVTVQVVNSNITNVYGYLNVSITGNNNVGFTIGISFLDTRITPQTTQILKLTTGKDFKITYDDVAKYIMNAFTKKGMKFPIRGKSSETNIIATRELTPSNSTNANIQLFNVDADLQILASLCLKTFCDKLYRTEEGVTHICTTDSYVYADPIIEYLAGNRDSIPTIMRSGDERSTDEKTDEPPPDTCELGSMGLSGRGFYIQPGVNSNSYIDTNYTKILKKTLGYAGFLKHLFSETRSVLGEKTELSQIETTVEIKMENIFVKDYDGTPLFSTNDGTLGKLVQSMPSYRLINFVERLILNKPVIITQINIDSYAALIQYLFSMEYNKIVQNVNEYIKTLDEIMNLNLLTDTDKIKTSIISLPDLEELLTMSTPSFCIENDDILIVSKDRVLTEVQSPYWRFAPAATLPKLKTYKAAPAKANFDNVIFSSKGIQITGCNEVFQSMAKDVSDYKSSSGVITGPITLDLLCKLKELNANVNVHATINNEIIKIITNFCNTCNLKCNINADELDNKNAYAASLDESEQRHESPLANVSASSENGRQTTELEQASANPITVFDDILNESVQSRKSAPMNASMSSDGSRRSAKHTPSHRRHTVSSESKVVPASQTRKRQGVFTSSSTGLSSSNNPATKKKRGGSSRHHKKASRKRNGRKMMHRTRKYKHR